MNEFVVIEDNGTGEILVLPIEAEYNYPNLIVHRGSNNCERESGYTQAEAKELAARLRNR